MACAHILGLDGIVTRDPEDFKAASIPVLSPAGVLEALR